MFKQCTSPVFKNTVLYFPTFSFLFFIQNSNLTLKKNNEYILFTSIQVNHLNLLLVL